MYFQKLRTSLKELDFCEATCLTHDKAPDYDQEAIDPGYDEGSQGEE